MLQNTNQEKNMRIDVAFLRSKVARRIFLLFMLCAMIPIFGLALISYARVSTQLKEQSMHRLYNAVKTHGMSVYEKFLFLETNMNIVVTTLKNMGSSENMNLEEALGTYNLKRFTALARVHSSGKIIPIFGQLNELPEDMLGIMGGGTPDKTLIRFKGQTGKPYNVFMAIPLDKKNQDPDFLVGQVEISHLWGIGYENMLPPMTGLCIVDQFRKVLVSSFEMSDNLLNQVVIKKDATTPNYFEYNKGNEKFFVSYWSVFLKSGFNAPNISVVLRRARTEVLSPLDKFKKIFFLVVLLSFWVVLLLSVYNIRKSLTPLEELKKGTLRIAQNDFKSQVTVTSNDEFEELADSFNTMSRSLGRNFEALINRSEIDRDILSSLNVRKIISRALRHMYQFFGCNTIGISLAIDKKPLAYHSYISTDIKVRKLADEYNNISKADENRLLEKNQYIMIDLERETPGYVAPSIAKNMKKVLVLPLIMNQVLEGTIALGFSSKSDLPEEDLTQARQIADQVMVALSNSFLVEKLEKLNLGTLEALARTVDAKSAWTAGHSERVMQLAVKIARIMGMKEDCVETLRRGAYLHDIGKIGIPMAILNKPGKLSDEEFNLIKQHPDIGVRILEPIEAYSDVLPTVAQHHEKYDGTGYPLGLKGEEISINGRIMAVADVYDALVSDRPYRQGWIEEKGVNIIKEDSGSHFDPKVVDAFLIAISS